MAPAKGKGRKAISGRNPLTIQHKAATSASSAGPLTSDHLAAAEIPLLFKLTHDVEAQTSVLTPKRNRCPQDFVTLNLSPYMRIRDIKSLLRHEMRIPFYENFMLSCERKTNQSCLDSTIADVFNYEEQRTIWVIMEGFTLDPFFYRKFLEERCDNTSPLGRSVDELPHLPHDGPVKLYHRVPDPRKLKLIFRLAHKLNREDVDLRDSVSFMVDPKMTIGILKIKLRSRLWIPFDEGFELAHLSGFILNRGDYLTLDKCYVKDHDTILVLMHSFPLDRRLLFDRSLVEFPLGETTKMQIFIKSAHYIEEFWRFPERSEDDRHIVRLIVEHTMTIGVVKSMLQSLCYWIPKQNLVLLSEPTTKLKAPQSGPQKGRLVTFYEDDNFGKSIMEYSPIHRFDDDHTTLHQCGIKDGDTLLSCMEDGEFETEVFDCRRRKTFRVRVPSCFHTINDLKRVVEREQLYYRHHQVFTCLEDNAVTGNKTPLVVLGVVKPFMGTMHASCQLKLRLREFAKKGEKLRWKVW